jgi:hypothetical protein
MRHKFLILLSLIWIAGCAGGNNSGQPVTENPVPQPVERFEKQNELPWENFGIYDEDPEIVTLTRSDFS